MQYQDYVTLVEDDYFGSISRGDLDRALACFTDTATVLIYHGDKAPRRFSRDGSSATPLPEFYAHLWGNFHPAFTDFRHYVDVEHGRCASTFLVTLEPKPDSAYAAHGRQQLNNCNFFDLAGELIDHMIIYYANPGAASAVTPTGYPRASG